jgi:predicted nucleotidyltransferase
MANGNATSSSDIDLMVVGEASFGDLITHLYPLEKTLGREVNPNCYLASVWDRLVTEEGAFVSDLLSKPVLFVVGTGGSAGGKA